MIMRALAASLLSLGLARSPALAAAEPPFRDARIAGEEALVWEEGGRERALVRVSHAPRWLARSAAEARAICRELEPAGAWDLPSARDHVAAAMNGLQLGTAHESPDGLSSHLYLMWVSGLEVAWVLAPGIARQGPAPAFGNFPSFQEEINLRISGGLRAYCAR